nr:hypothetical protein CFP56_32023 [Quercus suber]
MEADVESNNDEHCGNPRRTCCSEVNQGNQASNQKASPTGKLDCIDLGNGLFLVRFDTKDDLDDMLMKGPWFIGDHFLSIKPWEPFFKPSTTNVSLITVWVWLNELPIELYKARVFRWIKESIGRVLRIDTHTTMEAQGKYTKLCIQIDINKPLVNTILIGNFEQAVIYEGPMGSPCKEHEAHYTGQSSGMLEVSGMEEDEEHYEPLMVMTKKNAGHKGTRKGKGKPHPRDGVVQQQTEESIETHFPTDREECKDRPSSPHGFDLGLDVESMVAVLGGRIISGGRKENNLANDPTNLSYSDLMQDEPKRVTIRKEDARNPTHFHFHNGKLTHQQDHLSLQANLGV